MKVIAFVGYAGSGKDTAAGAILGAISGLQHFKWANTLKDIVCEVYGWDRAQLDFDSDYKEEIPLHRDHHYQCPGARGAGLSRRQVLQLLGTEGFREMIADDTWLRAAYRRINEIEDFARMHPGRKRVVGWVNTDTRFPDEADFTRRKFDEALIVRVNRLGLPTNTTSTLHRSEKAVDEISPDVVLNIQDGDLTALRIRALQIATEFFRIRE